METKWLEDFVSLAETRSFSRSAALRHVTQPAFSRRIQALEAWLGAELIDRSGYPTRLTQAGNIFQAQALAMLHQAREARTLLRGQSASSAMTIDFAVPHTLSLTFFPRWIDAIERRLGGKLSARLRALNVHDAVLTLTEGGCDLIMGYHHPSHPVVLDPRRYEFMTLGTELISPFCAPLSDDATDVTRHPEARTVRPRFRFPGTASAPAPYLAYSSHAYLGRMTEVLLMRAPEPVYLNRLYETDMAEGLKLMALAGRGIAFLPHSTVAESLAAGTLVPCRLETVDNAPMAEATDPTFTLTMEIRLYRDRLSEDEPGRRQLLAAVWEAARVDMDDLRQPAG